MFIGPKFADTSALREQTATAQQSDNVLRADIATLRRQQTGLPALVAKLRHARLELPVTDALPLFAATTNMHARATDIALTAMTVGLVAPVDACGAPAVPTATATGQANSPAGHLYAIPVTIVSNGSYDNRLRFLATLEKLGAGGCWSPGCDSHRATRRPGRISTSSPVSRRACPCPSRR